MEPDFVTVFDILDEGIGTKPVLFLLGWLAGLVLGTAMLRRGSRFGAASKVVFCIAWLTIWGCAGGVGIGNVLYQRLQCLAWARDGNFDVVKGEVRDFRPMPREGHAQESFTVSGVKFSYSDFDMSTGAFNNAASRGGPIRDGLYVLITHHDGRILKIEVRQQ